MKHLKLSSLPKTWLLDIDGTIVIHNGYLNNNEKLLEGTKKFIDNINPDDIIILLTSRGIKHKKKLEQFLCDNNIHFSHIIYDLPYGERILINDKKPSGLKTAYAINKCRNSKLDITFEVDESL
jgi:ribonucleotide monophosphatase NagD (HAD superfamily)